MRSWPLLALLILVVVVGAGCVLWFMREAARNERLGVRQRLADAYRSHLVLVQTQLAQVWREQLAAIDEVPPGPAGFLRIVERGLADSAVLPVAEDMRAVNADDAAAQGLQTRARTLAANGDVPAAIELIEESFAGDRLQDARDAQGRLVAGNAELFALELIGDRDQPRFRKVADRLIRRLIDYDQTGMPAAQRKFLMREVQRLSPGTKFSTLAAEDLAARYMEAASPAPRPGILDQSAPDLWQTATPGGRIALFTTAGLQARLNAMVTHHDVLASRATVALLAPGEEPAESDSMLLLTANAGPQFPRWRLVLALDDRSISQSAADGRVATYLWTGTLVVVAMLGLAALLARALGRQMRVARLKNDLVATVSHELKTPLTSMRALVDTLLDSDRIEEKTAREYLQLIAQENARLSRLIDNFLTFSRLERNRFSFNFTSLAPQVVVDAAVAAFAERCRSPRCRFEAQVNPALPSIRGDLDALVTALLNLLENAWKYAGEEKEITLRAELAKDSVEFAVQDNGIGLTQSDQRRIFRQFYQADQHLSRRVEGCGLGLSIVEQIVAAHGGAVGVTSQPGQGSTFTIGIPVVREVATL
jgi:signal transduction histidine kinase